MRLRHHLYFVFGFGQGDVEGSFAFFNPLQQELQGKGGFAHAGNILDQEVPACEQTRETQPDLLLLAQDHAGQLREHCGPQLLRTTIGVNVRLAEAPSHAKPIYGYAPSSTGAADYAALTDEVLAHG